MRKIMGFLAVVSMLFSLSACTVLVNPVVPDPTTGATTEETTEETTVTTESVKNPTTTEFALTTMETLPVATTATDTVNTDSVVTIIENTTYEPTTVSTMLTTTFRSATVTYKTEAVATTFRSATTMINTVTTITTHKPTVTTTVKPTVTAKPTTTKPAHTHDYADATCTEAQKCSCGETKGVALGHTWQEATCKAPKTCRVCNETDGEKGTHSYVKGICTYCNEKQIINPKMGLKENVDYYQVSAYGDGHYGLTTWQFNGEIICPSGVYSTNEEWKDGDETVSYRGKTYYRIGSGGPLPRYYLTDTEIILDFKNYPELSEDPDEYRLIVNYEYNLEVVYAQGGMFEKGDILELVE